MSEELTKQVDRLVKRGLNFWDIKATCGVSKEMLEYILENRELRIENKRLRKAGDTVSLCLKAYLYCKPYEGPMTIQCIEAWNAAKEGKQS